MDSFTDSDQLTLLLTNYGSIALFILLLLGIIAFPVPEETLMVIAGVLMRKGVLNIPSTALATYFGSISGITVSYLMGRLFGKYLAIKYGKWIGITEERLNKAHEWFEHFGKWAVFVGYYIPGVRHFTGFSAGMARLEYPHFALFAYTGAFFWVLIFLSIGYFFGEYCLAAGSFCYRFYEQLEVSADWVVIGLIVVVFTYILYIYRKDQSNRS